MSQCEVTELRRDNALPILHEVRHALKALIDEGTETAIDLQSLPMAPVDEQALNEVLGQGEVSITLNTLGESRITETTFPGVWLIEHFNEDGKPMGRFLEVCRIPAILLAHHEDMREGLTQLTERLT